MQAGVVVETVGGACVGAPAAAGHNLVSTYLSDPDNFDGVVQLARRSFGAGDVRVVCRHWWRRWDGGGVEMRGGRTNRRRLLTPQRAMRDGSLVACCFRRSSRPLPHHPHHRQCCIVHAPQPHLNVLFATSAHHLAPSRLAPSSTSRRLHPPHTLLTRAAHARHPRRAT